jgi:two-component system, NtrC family, response regulator HydG
VLDVEDFSISSLGATSGNALSTSPDQYQPRTLDEVEKAHIMATLDYAEGNKTKASQILGIERSTLDRKLKRY